MDLEIITPEQNIYHNNAYLVQFPSIDGLFEIMDNHAALIAVLCKGKIKVIASKDASPLFFDIKSGTVEVKNNQVTVLVD